ncbi:MAG: bifunctional DNA-formamidopyrimidine glycosylase/DNA-(apurinic or apyrimidinic site) lyase [Pseudomonadota bacterium]
MPELPEVETTRRGIAPHIQGRRVARVIVRNRDLRWRVTPRLEGALAGLTIRHVDRRAKYLLLATDNGTLILHLGMSGSLRIIAAGTAAGRHDHVDIEFENGTVLRYTDPRRFGSLHWTTRAPDRHRLLRDLGVEPLGDELTGDYLYRASRGRKAAIKQLLMDSHIVVGIGNIYASEALYMAGINPRRAAGRINRQQYDLLAEVIQEVLTDSIAAGGTTLRDFVNGEGKPGYFRMHLNVYGKAGEPCISCRVPIRMIRQGQRATFYCPQCQK